MKIKLLTINKTDIEASISIEFWMNLMLHIHYHTILNANGVESAEHRRNFEV